MRNAFIQRDKEGNVIRRGQPLPREFKGQAGFDQLSNKQLAVFGWFETNLSPFQASLANIEYDINNHAILTGAVREIMSQKYLDSMRSSVWEGIRKGIVVDGINYPFNYHHQIALQAACLIGGNITVYKDGVKDFLTIDKEHAIELLKLQYNNVDTWKNEYKFYCDRMQKGFDDPLDYREWYSAFRSAM